MPDLGCDTCGKNAVAWAQMQEHCKHTEMVEGLCRMCGFCTHDVLLNGVCMACDREVPTVTIKPGLPSDVAPSNVVPLSKLVRKP